MPQVPHVLVKQRAQRLRACGEAALRRHLDGEGREQVTGFFMGGELLGMDGIGSGRYNGNAVALEDSEVCVLPFAMIEAQAIE